MATITNKTGRPVIVPLPAGKRLFLGPRKSGEISSKAIEHPPIQKLIEAGEIELSDSGKGGSSGSGGKGLSGGQRGSSAGGIRHFGDR